MSTSWIFNFHGIGPIPDDVEVEERPYWMSREEFCRHLDIINQHRSEFGRDVQITFDDGNISDIETALPELLNRDLGASFFILTGRIGDRNYLDGLAINALLESGMIVGTHGQDHIDWRQADDTDLRTEVCDSMSLLADITGHAIKSAAIPFGAYSRRVLALLRRSGLSKVFTSDSQTARHGRWLQPRFTVTPETDVEQVLTCHESAAQNLLQVAKLTFKRIR